MKFKKKNIQRVCILTTQYHKMFSFFILLNSIQLLSNYFNTILNIHRLKHTFAVFTNSKQLGKQLKKKLSKDKKKTKNIHYTHWCNAHYFHY